MISIRRLVGCLIYYLRHFAQLVVPYRLISGLSAVYTRALRDTEDSAVRDNASRSMAEYRKDDDSKRWDRPDSDSDSDESLTCEYDSTWDEEDNIKSDTRKTLSRGQTHGWKHWSTGRNKSAARDMQIYRHNYPGLEDQVFSYPNLEFYRNEMASQPDRVFIKEYHNNWWGDYSRLERVHTFIQWLFPLQEDGMNYDAYKLTRDEIKAFIADETARERLKTSYELMLDFYGIKLVNHQTGEVERAENWKDRFHNLNEHTHNNLRITRILKCLGTLGFADYQAPLVRFFLKETLENGELQNVKRSVLDYFLFSVLDKSQRRELIREAFVMFHKSKGNRTSRWSEKFVWCPKWVQKRLFAELKREKTRTRPANQSLGCVDKTQPITEKNTSEAGSNERQLEGARTEGSQTEKQVLTSGTPDDQLANEEALSGDGVDDDSLASKHSDKNEETSGGKGQDEEEPKNTEAAGIAVEVQNNMKEAANIAVENANNSAVRHDSLVNGFLTNEQLHGENPTQYSTKEGDSHIVPEHEPSNKDPRTAEDDKLEDRPECRTQGVRPAGGSTGPSNRDKADILDNKNISTDTSTGRNLSSANIDGSDQENPSTMQMALKLNTVKDADIEKPVELSVEKPNGNSVDEQSDLNVCSQPDCNEGKGLEPLGDSGKKGCGCPDEVHDITVPKEDHRGEQQASQERQGVETAAVSTSESLEVEDTKL